jgi:hypothetical protein
MVNVFDNPSVFTDADVMDILSYEYPKALLESLFFFNSEFEEPAPLDLSLFTNINYQDLLTLSDSWIVKKNIAIGEAT